MDSSKDYLWRVKLFYFYLNFFLNSLQKSELISSHLGSFRVVGILEEVPEMFLHRGEEAGAKVIFLDGLQERCNRKGLVKEVATNVTTICRAHRIYGCPKQIQLTEMRASWSAIAQQTHWSSFLSVGFTGFTDVRHSTLGPDFPP